MICLFVCFVLLGGGSLSKEIPQQNFLGNIGLHYKMTSVTLVLQSDTNNIIVLSYFRIIKDSITECSEISHVDNNQQNLGNNNVK